MKKKTKQRVASLTGLVVIAVVFETPLGDMLAELPILYQAGIYISYALLTYYVVEKIGKEN